MARWPIVGRAEEFDVLAGEVGPPGMGEGRPGGVVVAGASGVGKSRLVGDFLERVAREGVRTVWVRATRSTATVPFGPFAAWAPEQASTAVTDRLQVLRAISRTLAEGAGGDQGDGRVLVAVDDAHLLDEGSAALVLHLVVHTGVSVVATVRSKEPCPDAVVALWKEGLAERIELQPLSRPETFELLERVLEGPVEPAVPRRLWALTEGTPLYLREVVRAAIDQGVLVRHAGAWRWQGDVSGGGRLGELIGDHLARASSEQRRVLELLAFGEPLPVDLLAELGSASSVAEAEQSGLVVVEDVPDHPIVRLAHPLYGEILRGTVPVLVAREYRRRLAAAALAAGWQHRDPLRVASWWLDSDTETGDPGGSSTPGAQSSRAGAGAAMQGRSPEHVDTATARVGAAGPEPDRAGVFLAAAQRASALAEWALADRLGRAAEASGAGGVATLVRVRALVSLARFDEADELLAGLYATEPDDEIAAEGAVARSDMLFWRRGEFDGARQILSDAAERFPAPLRSRVLARGAYLAAFACNPTAAVCLATEATAEAGPVTELRVQAMAAAALAWVLQGRTAASITAVEAAIPFVPAIPDGNVNPIAIVPAAYALAKVLAGRLDEAAAIAESVLKRAEHDEVPIFRGLAAALAARVALFEGRLAVARLRAQEAVAVIREAQLIAHWPAAVLATSAALLGDTATAASALERAATRDRTVPLYEQELNLARSWLAATRGELSAARGIASEVAAAAAAWGAFAYEMLALLDLARLGAPDVAAGRLTELASVIEGAYASTAAAYAGALAAHDGQGLDDASVRFEQMGAILLAAEAAAGASAAHRAAGRRGSHLTALARARVLASRCDGARTPALRDIDVEPALTTLTSREREVVELAARGLTNREIGTRLYVSVRTVNAHLNHAYSKLGLSDRTQLAALVLEPTDER